MPNGRDPMKHEHREHYWNEYLGRTQPYGQFQDGMVHSHAGGDIPHVHTDNPAGRDQLQPELPASGGRKPVRKPAGKPIGKQGGLRWLDQLGREVRRNLSGDDEF